MRKRRPVTQPYASITQLARRSSEALPTSPGWTRVPRGAACIDSAATWEKEKRNSRRFPRTRPCSCRTGGPQPRSGQDHAGSCPSATLAGEDAGPAQRESPVPAPAHRYPGPTFAFRFPLSPAPSRSRPVSPKARGSAVPSSCGPPAGKPPGASPGGGTADWDAAGCLDNTTL